MAARPPPICPACFEDLPAGRRPATSCASCGVAGAAVTWVSVSGGLVGGLTRVVFAMIPTAIAALMLVGSSYYWFGPPEPTWSPVFRFAIGVLTLAPGLFMLAIANLLWFVRRWTYRSRDGHTSGWVQTMFGRVFEADGSREEITPVQAPPATGMDSGALASCGVAAGLALTVLGMAARGTVVLSTTRRSALRRPANWPLCLGYVFARRPPWRDEVERGIEVASAASTDPRWLERLVLDVLAPPSCHAREAPYRVAAPRDDFGASVPLGDVLARCVEAASGPDALLRGAAADLAATCVVDAIAAERVLAACRTSAPDLVAAVERASSRAWGEGPGDDARARGVDGDEAPE